jgi:phosphotransferase system HPr (HPr) family protein
MRTTDRQDSQAAVAARRPQQHGVHRMPDEVLRKSVIIRNPQGFHVRPAAALAERARQFQSRVELSRGDVRVDGRQVLDLIMLAAEQGMEVTLEVSGPDAAEAIEILAQILGAEEPPPGPVHTLPQKG